MPEEIVKVIPEVQTKGRGARRAGDCNVKRDSVYRYRVRASEFVCSDCECV
jgi:hypothetical protein